MIHPGEIQKMKRIHDYILTLLLLMSALCMANSMLYAQNDLAEDFILVQGGSFNMGSSEQEIGRDQDEGPRHQVTVSSFALARTEVTRGELSLIHI